MDNELLLKLKEYVNLYDISIQEFVENYDVTQNIVDLCIDDEWYQNVEVIWVVIDNMDYIITLDGKIYTSEEVVIFA